MSVRESPVAFARRRSRCAVRPGRAFRAAEYSSRKAAWSERQLPPDSPSARPRFAARTRMGDGRFLRPNATRFSRSATHSARSDASRSR